jgi:hypothetical protein
MTTTPVATTSDPFAFLWGDAQLPEPIKLPESGGIQGFAGQWSCSVTFRFWHDQPIVKEDLDQANGAYLGNKSFPTGAFYYFKNYDAANKIGKLVGRQFGPNTVWRWEIPTSNILNIDDEMRSRFGDLMTYEVNVASLMAKKNRHELHMITLPSAVQAMAMLAGYIKTPIFDYESLRIDPKTVDYDYQMETVGNDAIYEDTVLWRARKDLWAVLGETDPKKYTVAQGGKFDTLSTVLASCLNIIYRPTNIYARLINVPDPRADATSNNTDDEGNKKHLTLPVVAQVWRDRTSCMSDLDIIEKATASNPNGHTNGKSTGLTIPAMWADYPGDWKNTVKEILNAYSGKPKPVIQKALEGRQEELLTNYGASAADFLAWADHIN